MQIIVPISHEDLPHLMRMTANIYRHRIDTKCSYSQGLHESVIEGERHMVDKLACVEADVRDLTRTLCRKWNHDAQVTVQENRRAQT